MTGIIYKITNTVNDKVYIGQTKRQLSDRYRQHLSDAKKYVGSNVKLYNAMNRYGADKFRVEVIEECQTEQLDEREKYWIKQCDSYFNGYNTTLGGNGRSKDCSSEVLPLWNSGKCMLEIAHTTGHATETVKGCLLSNGIPYADIKCRANKVVSRKNVHPVYQYDLSGNFVAEYASVYEAEKATGIRWESIAGVLYGQHHTTGKFQWSKRKADNIGACTHRFFGEPTPVHMYTVDGKYIKSYPSAEEARKDVGLSSSQPIRKACKKPKHLSVGCHWSYKLAPWIDFDKEETQ